MSHKHWVAWFCSSDYSDWKWQTCFPKKVHAARWILHSSWECRRDLRAQGENMRNFTQTRIKPGCEARNLYCDMVLPWMNHHPVVIMLKVCLQRSFFWNRSSQNSSQKIEPGVYDKFIFQAYVLVKKRHRTLCWLAYVPSLISLTFIESSEISFLVNVQYVVPAFCAQGFSSYSTYFKRPLGPPWHFRF